MRTVGIILLGILIGAYVVPKLLVVYWYRVGVLPVRQTAR